MLDTLMDFPKDFLKKVYFGKISNGLRTQTIIEPAHDILLLIILLSYEGSGEPAQMCRLARAFVARVHKV